MLTKRQQEFLAVVVRLAEGGQGVHYTRVAEVMGVSRWTAYDVLTSLVEKDMLEVTHELAREGGGGRSRVLFVPTARALAFLGKSDRPDGAGSGAGEVLARTGSGLWAKVLRSREQGVWNTLQELVSDLAGIRHPFVFCAYLLVIVLVALRASSQGDHQAILGYLGPLLNGPQIALVALAGCALAFLAERAPQGSSVIPLWQQLGVFEEHMKKLDHDETLRLRDFAAEVIEELWSRPAAAEAGS
ncbi:MAG: hypothetical protein QHH27_10755 [Clostridia bacterium]|jgi:hypothetical protein|nr:hypothetical protein [Clostridia bacterium]MDH7574002.1 hypothetical protein [Clostridia bacterium]